MVRINRIAHHVGLYFNRFRYNILLNRKLAMIEAIAVIVLLGRASAEGAEVFPPGFNPVILSLLEKWYSVSGSFFKGLPAGNPKMYSYWVLMLPFQFALWIFLTAISYTIAKAHTSKASFGNLLICLGIANIPLINWWFYPGCEATFVTIPHELHLDLLPPYVHNAPIPPISPIEHYWGYRAFGFICMLWSAALIWAVIKRELGVKRRAALLAAIPWFLYFAFLVVRSLRYNLIMQTMIDMGGYHGGLL